MNNHWGELNEKMQTEYIQGAWDLYTIIDDMLEYKLMMVLNNLDTENKDKHYRETSLPINKIRRLIREVFQGMEDKSSHFNDNI